MPRAPRPTTIFPNSTTTARQPSTGSTHQQSSALSARIAAKQSELENLKKLRDLSGALATQMGVLEEKLATLRDGTEAVACVLANWDHVLRAISMASSECDAFQLVGWMRWLMLMMCLCSLVKVPRPTATADGEEGQAQENGEEPQLPVTLVRIPAQSQDARERNLETNGGAS
jgi:DASH complex subunit DAD2